MGHKIKAIVEAIRNAFSKTGSKVANGAKTATTQIAGTAKQGVRRYYPILITAAVLGTIVYAVYRNPPVQAIQRGEAGIRSNLFTGSTEEFREGSIMVLPLVHELRRLPLRDLLYQPSESTRADGSAPFQSVEGLSIGVDLSIRYALDPAKLIALSKELPENFNEEVIQPATHGVVYKTFARYTVREIFSSKRADIQ
ncbi:MAG: SPFH domain-containing protein, partial [Casimicrobium sp.]